MKKRCAWVPEKDELYTYYHDTEWGIPIYDDNKIFEFLLLEFFQAGLSWRTILYKRENFRKAFDAFDAQVIARYSEKDKLRLQQDAGIIRNKLKIDAAVTNAKLFLKLQEKYAGFSNYIWKFTDGKPIINHWDDISQVPATSQISDKLSKDLKQLGFKFLGSTVVYAHMQATGMVNDHTTDCFRFHEIQSV